METAKVAFVCRSGGHTLTKAIEPTIRLIEGLGVEGDAHAGVKVKHRSRVARDPDQPNLRQVHLIHGELHDELGARGFKVSPGQMGENVTTRGIDLLRVPRGTRLQLGASAVVEITGLRNPCAQLDSIQQGLTAAVVERTPDGRVIRKAGVMAIVIAGGVLRAGDPIRATLPPEPHFSLDPV